METKTFYRVANHQTNQGLWYNIDGDFTGLIHTKFNFCKNTDLPMPFDEYLVNYLSSTETIEELFVWFPLEDIKRLEYFGYYITVFESSEYKYNVNHWLIRKETAKFIKRIKCEELIEYINIS